MEKTVTIKTTISKEKSNSTQSLKKIEDAVPNHENVSTRKIHTRTLSPIATQRMVVINRTNSTGPLSSMNMSRNFESYNNIQNLNMPSDVEHFKKGRENEKKDLRDLNEKLAGYIEQVRFLEAQNKKQADELSNLKERWGKDTLQVKEMYNIELKNLQELLIKAENYRAKIEIDLHNTEEEFKKNSNELEQSHISQEELKVKLEKCEEELIEAEILVKMLKKRISNLEEQRIRDRHEILKLREDMQTVLLDLSNETMKYLNSECELQMKRDELEFLQQVHEAQLNELSALVYRDTTKENKEFWKAEMAVAMQEIQSDYDDRMQTLRSTIESQCNINMQDIKTQNAKLLMELNTTREENRRIKGDLGSSKKRIPELENKINSLERTINELRHEMEENKRDFTIEISTKNKKLDECENEMYGLQKQLKLLLDDKLSLQLEIAAYRKLLEGEQSRWSNRTNTLIVQENGSISNSLANFVTQVQQEEKITKIENKELTQSSTSESSSRTTFNRNAKGNILIQECTPDGKCVILENNGTKKEDVSDMLIQRDVDHGKQLVKYVIPKKTFIDPGKTLKIWAKGLKPTGSLDLECLEFNWGIGNHIHTLLINSASEERATYTQKSVYMKKAA